MDGASQPFRPGYHIAGLQPCCFAGVRDRYFAKIHFIFPGHMTAGGAVV